MNTHKTDNGFDVVQDTAKWLWRWRVEWAIFLSVYCVAWGLSLRFSTEVGMAATVVLVAAVFGNALLRSSLRRALGRASVRRRLAKAIADARRMNQPPRIVRVVDTPVGEQLTVEVRSGDDVEALVASSAKLAASMRVASARVTRDPQRKMDSSRAVVTLVRHDPLDTEEVYEWPNLYAPRLSVYDPIPCAKDEFGRVHYMNLLKPDGARTCLLGGEMGSGKSNAISLLVATAALDPDCDLWIFDGKDYELTDWAPACQQWTGQEGMPTYQGLQAVQSIMNERRTDMRERGQRHITRGDGIRPQVVIIDELPWYISLKSTNVGKKPIGTAIQDVATDITRRGRSAGVFLGIGIQRPSHDVIDTSLRDLISYKWGFRQNTSTSSDMVLGDKMASQGFDSSTIGKADTQKGVGYFHTEGGHPVRSKAFRLDDDQVRMLASRAVNLRIDNQWSRAEIPSMEEEEA